MYWLPRSVKPGLRGLYKWFRSLSTTLLYPWVGQVGDRCPGCVAGDRCPWCVAGGCPRCVAGRPHAYFAISISDFQLLSSLADDVIRPFMQYFFRFKNGPFWPFCMRLHF